MSLARGGEGIRDLAPAEKPSLVTSLSLTNVTGSEVVLDQKKATSSLVSGLTVSQRIPFLRVLIPQRIWKQALAESEAGNRKVIDLRIEGLAPPKQNKTVTLRGNTVKLRDRINTLVSFFCVLQMS